MQHGSLHYHPWIMSSTHAAAKSWHRSLCLRSAVTAHIISFTRMPYFRQNWAAKTWNMSVSGLWLEVMIWRWKRLWKDQLQLIFSGNLSEKSSNPKPQRLYDQDLNLKTLSPSGRTCLTCSAATNWLFYSTWADQTKNKATGKGKTVKPPSGFLYH